MKWLSPMRRFSATRSLLFLLLAFTVTSAAQERGKQFEAHGVSIYYEVLGSSKQTPLVVINGGPGFDHTYLHISPVWNSLSKTQPVIFYDQRGNGRSSKLEPGDSCNFEDQINDLESLRMQLGAEKINIVGHSWGGFLGMGYAARFPDRVAHLVLVDSVPPRWEDIQSLYRQVFPELGPKMQGLGSSDQKVFEEALNAWLSTLFYSPEKRAAFLKALSPDAVNNAVREAVVKDIGQIDLTSDVAGFQFPTLVINGRFDVDITPAVALKLHDAIPNSEFVIFEQSGHFSFYEEPEKFVRTVQDFLAR
jgi:proline iminopeptidase